MLDWDQSKGLVLERQPRGIKGQCRVPNGQQHDTDQGRDETPRMDSPGPMGDTVDPGDGTKGSLYENMTTGGV